MFIKSKKRTYTPIGIVELKFRSIPERLQQGGYGFVGKADISFTSYALNEDELKVLREQIQKDDIVDVFSLIEGATAESLGELKKDIDEFLGNEKPEEKENVNEKEEDINPFT